MQSVFRRSISPISWRFHDSTIVAGSDDCISSNGKVRKKDLEQPIFPELPKASFHQIWPCKREDDGDRIKEQNA